MLLHSRIQQLLSVPAVESETSDPDQEAGRPDEKGATTLSIRLTIGLNCREALKKRDRAASQCHANQRPRREITGDLRNGLPPHPETQQTQIDNHQGSNEHAKRHDMKCLINGKHPLRLLEPETRPRIFTQLKKPIR